VSLAITVRVLERFRSSAGRADYSIGGAQSSNGTATCPWDGTTASFAWYSIWCPVHKGWRGQTPKQFSCGHWYVGVEMGRNEVYYWYSKPYTSNSICHEIVSRTTCDQCSGTGDAIITVTKCAHDTIGVHYYDE